ncbi:MAG: DNA polymerase III subunit beta [Acidaminococcaceae bacterium]|nr:DNA polymerase III subunit beta [Acidaminococcaceae bacterium]MBR1493619.1 DNA polymerase III subunit beta [Acidaminococcaceae bacterium]
MKFTCETAELNKAVQSVMPAIASKPSTPIFGGMHIIADGEKLRLEGMDINLSMSNEIKAVVEEPGEIVINASRLNDLARNFNGETVKVTKYENDNNVRLQSGKADYKILLMNVNEYPKYPSIEATQSFTLEEEKIKELIKKTSFACSTDNARPLFTGVLCEIKDNKITFVGTNTHRLAIRTLDIDNAPEMSVIIPSVVLKEINKNLNGKLPQEVTFFMVNNQLMVKIENWTVVSRLIEGKFPDYKRVIPPNFTVKTKVNVKELQGAVSRMSLCSGSENDYSIVKISIKENEIKVMSSSPDVGTGEEIISCKTEGSPINVAFNAAYIMDIMKNIETDEAEINLNNSLSPVCIKPDSEEEYIYIVTPVRVIF